MPIIFLILIIILGTTVSIILASQNQNGGGFIYSKQSQEKQANKQKILEYLETHNRITNNDVEKLCEVSNATAERYLDELEKKGFLKQHGEIGQGVYYTKNE